MSLGWLKQNESIDEKLSFYNSKFKDAFTQEGFSIVSESILETLILCRKSYVQKLTFGSFLIYRIGFDENLLLRTHSFSTIENIQTFFNDKKGKGRY